MKHFLILLSLIQYSLSIITFPFQRIFDDDIITNETFYKNYYYNKLYTKISIGSSNTQIALQIKFKQYSFCVRNDTIYDYNNSNSYINNEDKDMPIYNIDFKRFMKSNETFIFGKEKIRIDDMKFLLTKESKYNSDGILGLQIYDNERKSIGYNLISQLKDRKLIKKESFFFVFDENSDNGELIIGDYPHFIDKYKDIYHEEQFQVTCIFIPSYEQNFDIRFRRVSWNGSEFESLTVGYLKVESGMIVGSLKFCDVSWDFFGPHFRKKKCQIVAITIFYQSYICDDYEDFDITKFPSIKFYISDADYNLELTYKELFVKKDGKYYFLVCFDKKRYNVNWELGNILLKRNMLVFDMDRKIIGFYNKTIGLKQISTNRKFWIIFIIIIAVIVFGCVLIAFIIIKLLYGQRRKKAYELDDNYDYKTIILND